MQDPPAAWYAAGGSGSILFAVRPATGSIVSMQQFLENIARKTAAGEPLAPAAAAPTTSANT